MKCKNRKKASIFETLKNTSEKVKWKLLWLSALLLLIFCHFFFIVWMFSCCLHTLHWKHLFKTRFFAKRLCMYTTIKYFRLESLSLLESFAFTVRHLYFYAQFAYHLSYFKMEQYILRFKWNEFYFLTISLAIVLATHNSYWHLTY